MNPDPIFLGYSLFLTMEIIKCQDFRSGVPGKGVLPVRTVCWLYSLAEPFSQLETHCTLYNVGICRYGSSTYCKCMERKATH